MYYFQYFSGHGGRTKSEEYDPAEPTEDSQVWATLHSLMNLSKEPDCVIAVKVLST